MSNRLSNTLAFVLLLTAFLLCFTSTLNDSWTFDETAHIGAGYSYLTQQDYRLNPEHPPLIKDIAAVPLLFLDLNFPKEAPSWTQEENPVWWLQFNFAHKFLYDSDNNPEQILIFAHTAMIFMFLFLAWLVFFWTKNLFGNKTAVLALFFISFSPTLLAHGRLVTTDVAAALGVVLATCFWIRFLKNPSFGNILLTSFILGISLLFKFSLLLIIPFVGIVTFLYAWIYKKSFLKYTGLASLVGLIALIFVIWPIYQAHTFNYPIEQQLKDTTYRLESFSAPEPLSNGIIWMTSKPVLRSLAHYFTGITMVLGRTAGGNTTFFLGDISAEAWRSYFPIVYLIKVPLSFHLASLIAIYFLLSSAILKRRTFLIRKWAKAHFPEIAMVLFLIIYWLTSIRGNLNIGIRHLLPVFPFTIILVSRIIVLWLKKPFLKLKYVLFVLILLWQVFSIVQIYPHFIAYFNQAIGGAENGYKYVTDSNLDWGQDLKRLSWFVDEKDINTIYLDYFGGGSPEYYLGQKYQPWDAKAEPEQLPKDSWLAVSANELQGGRAKPVKNYDGETGYYNWLNNYQPITVVGHSIFVYHIR